MDLLISKPARSTEEVPGWSGLHRETLSGYRGYMIYWSYILLLEVKNITLPFTSAYRKNEYIPKMANFYS